MFFQFKSRTAGRFLAAAHAGNHEKLLELITKGIDVNLTNEVSTDHIAVLVHTLLLYRYFPNVYVNVMLSSMDEALLLFYNPW